MAVGLSTPGSQPRKKKGRASYAVVDLDSADEPKKESENIRVWNISKSETTGRVSATRKNHKHAYARLPKPLCEEFTTIEDSDAPANVEQSEQQQTKSGTKRKRVRTKAVKDNDSTNMEDWRLGYLSVTLDEILRLDGLGDSTAPGTCANCSTESLGEYRCIDCWDDSMYCSRCLLSFHRRLPLHRIEVWANGFFKRISLESLGLVVNIGHSGNPCSSLPESQKILVVSDSGQHTVQVRFCKCSKNGFLENFRQLLRLRLYPASAHSPKTVSTFDFLDTYHKISLQGKLNLYDFYHAIMRKSDNHGGSQVKSRYHEMSRSVRQWRHIKALKQGGAGHTTNAVDELEDGAIAIECPACPHPGRNLPAEWDTAPNDRAWLYSLFLAIDANFRLKQKSRAIKDPELGQGLAYFVNMGKFQKLLTNGTQKEEIETCGAEFHAVNQANSRSSKGFSVSGVGAIVCRHGLVRKNGVVDLQKGERYVNMDYIFLSTVKGEQVKSVKISYDIACRWSINLFQRIKTYPEELQFPETKFSLEYFIPKFHLPAHGSSCHTKYSFNYRPGVGRTHGENIESGWAHVNPAAVATREMGPGARHSALDGHWGGWNWRKVVGFGALLLKNLEEARRMLGQCEKICKDFERQADKGTVMEWHAMKSSWERDPSKPDPYRLVEKSGGLGAAKKKLAEAEAFEAKTGVSMPHKLHPASFVRMGLEIEDQQQQIIEHLRSNRQRTDPQKVEIQQRRNVLTRRINVWRIAQGVYMPQVTTYLSDESNALASDDTPKLDNSKPETWSLFLPSSLPQDDRSSCYKGIITTEQTLRLAQLQDSLADLRQSRRALRNLRLYFKTNLTGEGQKTQTRSRAIETNAHNRIKRAVRRYRTARDALFELDPTGTWQKEFQVLRDEDNRGPLKESGEEGVGDGRHAPSWIWTVPSAASLPSKGSAAEKREMNETARFEWMTCRARADRWKEEEELLQEEMRRVLVYLEWKSGAWSKKVGARGGFCSSDIQHGIDAYARKQASIHHEIAVSFASQWLRYLTARGYKTKWSEDLPWISEALSRKATLPRWLSTILAAASSTKSPSPGSTEVSGTKRGNPDPHTIRNGNDSCEGHKHTKNCEGPADEGSSGDKHRGSLERENFGNKGSRNRASDENSDDDSDDEDSDEEGRWYQGSSYAACGFEGSDNEDYDDAGGSGDERDGGGKADDDGDYNGLGFEYDDQYMS